MLRIMTELQMDAEVMNWLKQMENATRGIDEDLEIVLESQKQGTLSIYFLFFVS